MDGKCVNCGAVLSVMATACAYCGTPVPAQDLPEARREEIVSLVESLNMVFVSDEKRASNWGVLGCFISLALLVGLPTVLIMGTSLAWWAGILVGVAVFLLFVGLSLKAEDLFKERYYRRNYAEVVKPQIDGYLAHHHLTSWQFNLVAHDVLNKEAPLRRYLFLD